MNDRLHSRLRWSARILACLVGLFPSVFALDAFGHGTTPIDALPDFAIHLAPAHSPL
jgi:hypothetical protein